MIVIPAIDIHDGAAVRLTRGDYHDRKIYSRSPAAVAAEFFRLGFPLIHVVDLEGAKQGKLVNFETIQSIAGVPGGGIEVGGGIRTGEDIEMLLALGVQRVITGSVAVTSPESIGTWLQEFGPEKVVIGLDIKQGRIAHSGWLHTSEFSVEEFIPRMIGFGARVFICTDVSKDGMLEGPNVKLYGELVTAFPAVEFIASGGVSSINDIHDLETTGVTGVIVGKAIYEGNISPADLKEYTS
jgi:phosphoribosylformimino-5-aminoimidazole carboxamide ribotide isomerase